MIRRHVWIGCLFVALLSVLSLSMSWHAAMRFPDTIAVPSNDAAHLHYGLPLRLHIQADRHDIVKINGQVLGRQALTVVADAVSIQPLDIGRVRLDMRLFGIIPFRNLTVEVRPPLMLYPGGHSIGIMLQADGVFVVAHAPVMTLEGERVFPARQAGVRVGDLIVAIDDVRVHDVETAADRLQLAAMEQRAAALTIRRDERELTVHVHPHFDRQQGRPLIGLWIRDAAAGIGTLSFYEPGGGDFGALGHQITDVDSGFPLHDGTGKIVQAKIVDIEIGRQGRPGAKIGTFNLETANPVGVIEQNTPLGIFGRLEGPLPHPFYAHPLPVATPATIKTGPAEMLTVVDGQMMQRFAIEIERILGRRQQGRNMIIRVVDRTLLAKTGGIVQGMSGSPIIQDGRLVGVVTHVFVNDPTRGYAVFIQEMIDASGRSFNSGQSDDHAGRGAA